MQKSAIALVLLVALVASSNAKVYERIAGYFEGTALDLWNFGATTGTPATGDAFQTIWVKPGTSTSGPDGGSRGEIQLLLCNGSPCPEILSSNSPSLWRTWQAKITGVTETSDNTTYTSFATFDTNANFSTSTGNSYNYRRMVSAGDLLQTTANLTSGLPATKAYYAGSAVYYFSFGTDSYPGYNAVYQLEGGPALLLARNTHFVKLFNIKVPPGATESPTRVSEIPVAWLTNPNITTTDNKIYEFGFNANAATPAPVAAASTVVPGLFVALVALFAALIF